MRSASRITGVSINTVSKLLIDAGPAGDVWTWTAIDADSKLIVSWHVGDRSAYTGTSFMGDLKARLANRGQLTTDGHKAYLKAVAEVDFDADYACS